MSLSASQIDTLRQLGKTREFRRQRQIQRKSETRNTIHHVGKGFYYFIEYSRPHTQIMDVITSDIEKENGGYVRKLHHWKKGNKCNISLLASYEIFNESAAAIGVGINQFQADAHIETRGTHKRNNSINNNGEANCDILVIQIGGTTNGCCCRNPSLVTGDLIIKTISDQALNDLRNKEKKEDGNICKIM